MMAELNELHARNQQHGRVSFLYTTKLHFGRLT
jgi:hypothetical protein